MTRTKIGLLLSLALVGIAAVIVYYVAAQQKKPSVPPEILSPSPTVSAAPTPESSPTAEVVAKKPSQPAASNFDKCGPLSKYQTEPWAPLLRAKPEAAQLLELCYARNTQTIVFVSLQPDNQPYYCSEPFVYRYRPSTNEVVRAKVEVGNRGEGCNVAPHEFGAQEGAVIHLLAPGDNGDCKFSESWDYYYQEGRIRLTRESNQCGNQPAVVKTY